MRIRTGAIISAVMVLLLGIHPAGAEDYAVLISAGQTTEDDAVTNCEYWYDLMLQYTTLIDEGYSHDDVYVLYGEGTDFVSSYECYQNPYSDPITDYNNHKSTINSVFASLADVVTEDDFLYVWWMGHGAGDGPYLVMLIENTGQEVYDYEFASYVDQITDYNKRAFSFMTCQSGGILDDLQNSKSIVMSACTFYEFAASEWLCDSWHAELHYYESCAFHWETPCGICGPVNADTHVDDDRISFTEAFGWAQTYTQWSTPQMSDLGGLAPGTFLVSGTGPECCSCLGDFPTGDPPQCDGYRNATDFTVLAAAFNSQVGDPAYNVCCDIAPETPDGYVNITDFTAFAASYLVPCP